MRWTVLGILTISLSLLHILKGHYPDDFGTSLVKTVLKLQLNNLRLFTALYFLVFLFDRTRG